MRSKRINIGIIGCGAIGSRIAESVKKDMTRQAKVSALYDVDEQRAMALARKLSIKGVVKSSLQEVVDNCDLMVEAVSAANTRSIIRTALLAKKNVLAMSVGRLLNSQSLFDLAKRQGCSILLPSGAICGIDAIKAAAIVGIDSITITTRKPPAGLAGNPYFESKGIRLSKIKKETLVFEGSVDEAVKYFPRNINVAATLALASGVKDKIIVRILTSPKYVSNTHEIEVKGSFGRIWTRTDNVVCPDNPKTSYLAVLSGMQTLRQFCSGIVIGT